MPLLPALAPDHVVDSDHVVGPAPEQADVSPARRWIQQIVSFAGIGLVANIAYAALFVVLRMAMGAVAANVVALVVSTVGDTSANRRLTFGVRNRSTVAAHQTLGIVLLGIGLVVTSGSLWLLELTVAAPSRLSELAVLGAANLVVGVIRFAAFRRWMHESLESTRASSAASRPAVRRARECSATPVRSQERSASAPEGA